ncbi:MAG: lipoyl synthase [Deltaproteobacteria bacterium]|nr:lipoyl synthase [Deltaproteobacteria bacterium]
MGELLPLASLSSRTKKPEWLKVRAPGGPRYSAMKSRARRLSLATVCEEAQCPNIGECWNGGTATFMLMGESCTRGCRFCAVDTKRSPPALDLDEPTHLADAVEELGLGYVVVTSVNRDDLPDGGAQHLCNCLQAVHARAPKVLIELLMPDFDGLEAAITTISEAPMAVAAHNVETVERLTPSVRDPRAGYRKSLEVLRRLKAHRPERLVKSSVMLGLGESEDEATRTIEDLRDSGVDILTLGQYLRPSLWHLPVHRFVPPDEFDRLGERARSIGFEYVAAGPLVRSSYRAGELFVERHLRAPEPPRPTGTGLG